MTDLDFLLDKEAWFNQAHAPSVFARANDFAQRIGACQDETFITARSTHVTQPHAYTTHWYVPHYNKGTNPLFGMSDSLPSQVITAALLGMPKVVKSYNMFVQNEYNPALGVTFTAQDHSDDLAWVIHFTRALMDMGYPEDKTAEMIMLLHEEWEVGRGETLPTGDNWLDVPRVQPRPTAMLLANIRSAGILAQAEHLSPDMRRRYMRRAIPVDVLESLIQAHTPYTYATSLYPPRGRYAGGA